jgi:EpsG family
LIFYLSLALIFWAFVLIGEYRKDLNQLLIVIVTVAFVILAGCRWETGYDWIAYEQAVAAAPSLLSLSFTHLPEALRPMEPLFVILLSVIKTFGGTIQALYLIVALFNAAAFYIFVRYFRVSVVFVFAIYFCWVYLLAQMAIIRQSIALSFLMLSLIRFNKAKHSSALALFLVAIGFQYSVLMFAPIFVIKAYKKIIAFKFPILLALLVFYLSGISLFDILRVIVENMHFRFVADKFQHYYNAGFSPRTLGAGIYLLINIFTFWYLSKFANISSRLEKALMLSILLTIVLETIFWQFSLLWERAHYFVVIAQGILLYKTWETINPLHRAAQFSVIFALSIVALIKPLLSETALPYIPYQSNIRFIYTNEAGDGRKRLENYNLKVSEKECVIVKCRPVMLNK